MVIRDEGSAGALYHVTSRAESHEGICIDDVDREMYLTLLGEVCGRFEWTIHAYCLLPNHYHLLVETLHPNLAQGMRQLEALYTRTCNQRHRRVGPVFQGRFGVMQLQRDPARLLELNRYVVLSPVRADLVATAIDWRWSSYRASAALTTAPAWLAVDPLLAQFGKERAAAVMGYVAFVAAAPTPNRRRVDIGPVLLGTPPPARTLSSFLRTQLMRRRIA